MLTVELPSNTVFRSIRWNGPTRIGLDTSVETVTVKFMDGNTENFDLPSLRNVLTEQDAKTYLKFVAANDVKGQWVECTGQPYCDARR